MVINTLWNNHISWVGYINISHYIWSNISTKAYINNMDIGTNDM